ncbi:MAG: methyltransferase domain-containing protein [Bryobacteraceae bacterium]
MQTDPMEPAGEARVADRMRADWNQRAGEDAHYYVAFGRRQQSEDEFFATGAEQVKTIEWELRRLAPGPVRARRALEIGCGPGRLMRPLSRHFGEIHGVDISDLMIERARKNLAGIPHAHPHHAPDSDLSAFADASFDLVYSYAVFQHIPSREVVMGYLREAVRVMKPGAILRCQINGLPESAKSYDTWAGVRIPATAVREFAAEHGMTLLALEGVLTQYMWVTMRKPPAPGEGRAPAAAAIRRITNAHSSEPFAPSRGRFAALSIWVEGVPADAGINTITVRVGGREAEVTYLGHPEHDGLRQLNVLLPPGLETGLAPVTIEVEGELLCPAAAVRLLPPPPVVPRVTSLRDGIDLVSGERIVSGAVKATIEELHDPESLSIAVGEAPAREVEWFCIDPRVPTYEVNFHLPEGTRAGTARVRFAFGGKVRIESSVEVIPEATDPVAG